MVHEKSCGAVVYTQMDHAIKYVLVQQSTGSYGFPKGHVEKDETEMETALREIYEETGLKPRIIDGFKAADEYPLPNKNDVIKQVVYFLAKYENQAIFPQESELLNAVLVPLEEALALLQHDSLKRILRQAHVFLS